MRVSLAVLRLEIADECDTITSLNYVADSYLAYAADGELALDASHDLSLTLQSEPIHEPVSFKEIPNLHRGKRDLHKIVIETYYQDMEQDDSAAERSPREQRMSESSDISCKNLPKSPRTIQYFSGNPSVEVTKGIMHLYKDKYLTPLDPDVPRSEMICMLGVPAKISCQDLQKYIAPARDTLEHIKIIRDSIPNQYMVLLKFKDQLGADEFFKEYEGKPYNMLESEFSHLVYVQRVEAIKSSQGGCMPASGLIELPICPVCLERMDESVAGVLTVICNHSFHNDCLMKWQDEGSCPVCRYHQTPEPSVDQTCFECDSKESLWMCLICGHVGCGRYQEQHAFQHYQQTAHTFSMQLGNQRVWDYTGDNFVHRLIQNKGDGKLIALDHGESTDYEKLDSLTLEYTYLLTNQLESQRLYFEEKIDFMEKDAYDKISLMEASYHKINQKYQQVEKKLAESEKDRKSNEKKYENMVSKATSLGRELRDEKQMNVCLRDNQVMWQQKVQQLEERLTEIEQKKSLEILELKADVSDLMKHLEVQSAIGNAEQEIKNDIQGGQVFVDQSSSSSSPSRTGARSKGKSKKH